MSTILNAALLDLLIPAETFTFAGMGLEPGARVFDMRRPAED